MLILLAILYLFDFNGILVPAAVADDAHRQPLDIEALLLEIHLDGFQLFVFRMQPDQIALAIEAFDGHLVITHPRNHHLAVARLIGLVHRQQIAIQDADVLHAHTVHPQQEIGMGMEHLGIT